ncbi:MAG: hypothetical protein WDM81_04455 [Rhizomicrobium sp.]
MQTWLVHTRRPLDLLRNVGPKGFLAFHLFIGGSVLTALLNPVLWAVFVATVFFRMPLFGGPTADAFLIASGAGLVGGHAILTGLAVVGPLRRGWGALAPYGFTVTLYWALISFAAIRGLHQFVFNTFHWDKTEHGVSRTFRQP